ncbi:MAG: right-handed parallel beta-helix repeat-containing protein [bacterium]|nr:right-handed parallel beta-helix repeat-containing protein [bacterium]
MTWSTPATSSSGTRRATKLAATSSSAGATARTSCTAVATGCSTTPTCATSSASSSCTATTSKWSPNLVVAADPHDGMGLGLKEAGNVTATGNRIVRCPTGIFVDTSPIQISHVNRFTGNAFEFCDTGVLFHSSEKRNEFVDNAFHGCAASVRVDGHGDATHVTWRGNYFEDYAGFDLDGDGTGDVPHEPRSLSGQLTSTREAFRFFRGTPAPRPA